MNDSTDYWATRSRDWRPRKSKLDIPGKPSVCGVREKCVYRGDDAACTNPRLVRGCSDAACHKIHPAKLSQRYE